MRDWFATALKTRGGALQGNDPALFDPRNRRLQYEGRRPLRCPPPR